MDDIGKKILIVDDEEEVANTLKEILERKCRYVVKTLSEAKDVLSCVHAFNPDVILLDLVMPKIGGLEACEMLDNDPIGSGIPVIIISGLEKDADKAKAYKLGVVDYLVKPLQHADIIAAIEKAIKHKSEGD